MASSSSFETNERDIIFVSTSLTSALLQFKFIIISVFSQSKKMMDNELPWNPPEPQQRQQTPKTGPEVPDVTLFSPTIKTSTTSKTNFLQRALANPINKQAASSIGHNNDNKMFTKPSVPDVSLLDPRISTVPNLLFTKNNNRQETSNENIFGSVGKPSVPDLTILDEEPKQKADRVYGESYSKQLLNSHEQFLKQLRKDHSPSPEPPTNERKKSSLFNTQQTKYQENPLRKYAPKHHPPPNDYDGNSSSILVETNNVTLPSALENGDKSDEMTFKKVAEMLCEIQKFVIIPEKTEPADQTPLRNSQKCAVLKKLASTYLTNEEYDFYDIERELDDIESNS